MDILTNNPQAPSGIYTIDPDEAGSKDPFQVECKMIGTNGWTLVGLEKPNSSENLKFLGVEKGTPADLIAKNNALIGTRFRGLYTAVRIEWDTTRYVEFIKNGAEIFDDTVDVAISIKSVTSSEGNFNTWISGGAKLCRATSQSGSKMPGDSSWALKPSNDNFIQCGCNSGMWKGQGLYYSGTGSQCTSCGCSTGGFVGAKDTNDMKSGVVSWETRIYVL